MYILHCVKVFYLRHADDMMILQQVLKRELSDGNNNTAVAINLIICQCIILYAAVVHTIVVSVLSSPQQEITVLLKVSQLRSSHETGITETHYYNKYACTMMMVVFIWWSIYTMLSSTLHYSHSRLLPVTQNHTYFFC